MWAQAEKTQGQAKMAAWNSFNYICTRALHYFLSFTHCRAASTVIPLLPKATYSLTSVTLVPGPHILRRSTPFWPYGNHPFFPHAHTFSILSDLLYSLTPFYSSSPTHLFIPNSVHSRNCSQNNFINKDLCHDFVISRHEQLSKYKEMPSSNGAENIRKKHNIVSSNRIQV